MITQTAFFIPLFAGIADDIPRKKRSVHQHLTLMRQIANDSNNGIGTVIIYLCANSTMLQHSNTVTLPIIGLG